MSALNNYHNGVYSDRMIATSLSGRKCLWEGQLTDAVGDDEINEGDDDDGHGGFDMDHAMLMYY